MRPDQIHFQYILRDVEFQLDNFDAFRTSYAESQRCPCTLILDSGEGSRSNEAWERYDLPQCGVIVIEGKDLTEATSHHNYPFISRVHSDSAALKRKNSALRRIKMPHSFTAPLHLVTTVDVAQHWFANLRRPLCLYFPPATIQCSCV